MEIHISWPGIMIPRSLSTSGLLISLYGLLGLLDVVAISLTNILYLSAVALTCFLFVIYLRRQPWEDPQKKRTAMEPQNEDASPNAGAP